MTSIIIQRSPQSYQTEITYGNSNTGRGVLTIAPEVVVAFAYAQVSALALVITMHRFVAFPHIFTVYVSICAFSYTGVLAVVPTKIMHLSLGFPHSFTVRVRIRVCMQTHTHTRNYEQLVCVCSIWKNGRMKHHVVRNTTLHTLGFAGEGDRHDEKRLPSTETVCCSWHVPMTR